MAGSCRWQASVAAKWARSVAAEEKRRPRAFCEFVGGCAGKRRLREHGAALAHDEDVRSRMKSAAINPLTSRGAMSPGRQPHRRWDRPASPLSAQGICDHEPNYGDRSAGCDFPPRPGNRSSLPPALRLPEFRHDVGSKRGTSPAAVGASCAETAGARNFTHDATTIRANVLGAHRSIACGLSIQSFNQRVPARPRHNKSRRGSTSPVTTDARHCSCRESLILGMEPSRFPWRRRDLPCPAEGDRRFPQGVPPIRASFFCSERR